MVAGAGHEQDQAGVVPAVYGEARKLSAGDGAADGRLLGLEDGGGGGDLDGFGDLTDFEGEIDLDDGVKVNYPKFDGALKKITGLEATA